MASSSSCGRDGRGAYRTLTLRRCSRGILVVAAPGTTAMMRCLALLLITALVPGGNRAQVPLVTWSVHPTTLH